MSISWGTQYSKLKTNLRLAINRLKLLEKKKTEQALKARTEIADFIVAHKPDRARIRVEHIIREDEMVEAFELLEMYCDLLLARFGLIEQMKTLDEGIAEAVISILWAAPRIATDIAEFKTISDQLTLKYGKPFAEAARANQLEHPARVAPKLLAKLSVNAPPKLLVEKYMIEIARSAGIEFTPDPDVMREDETAAAERNLIDFQKRGEMSGVVGYGGLIYPANPSQGIGWMYSDNGASPAQNSFPPPGPGYPGGGFGMNFYSGPPPSNPPPPPPHGGGGNVYEVPFVSPPSYPQKTDFDYAAPTGFSLPKIGGDGRPLPPNYPQLSAQSSVNEETHKPKELPGGPSAPPASLTKNEIDADLAFPEPPSSTPGGANTKPPGGNGGDLDFDDLAKRFDALKKKP